MRSYDPYFLDGRFAVDNNLKRLLKAARVNVSNYYESEAFFVAVAKKLKIKCWDLDTILFNHYDQIEKTLSAK